MDTETSGNGDTYVPVPSLKIGELPVAIVSEMLAKWHTNRPEEFGSYLAEAYTGTKPGGRRS
jgi:hypothetical protein